VRKMCDRNDTILIWLPSGEQVEVDRCMAPIISTLNDAGICTVSSCCGHKEELGHIWLQDGKVLVILPSNTTKDEVVEVIRRS